MDTTAPTTPTAAHALSPHKAWLVGGGLALVAVGSLATALALKGPAGATAAAEPRETIVSSKSPAPKAAAAAERRAEGSRASTAPATAARPACADCAVVQAVTAIERRGEATGAGAVAGAVAGGVLGHQMGGGSGKDAMTVLGAVGGGVAGHHMERKLRSRTEYRVRVKLADGSTRTLSHPTKLAVGDTVRVKGDTLVATAPAAAPMRTAQNTADGAPEAAAPAPRPRSMAEAKRL